MKKKLCLLGIALTALGAVLPLERAHAQYITTVAGTGTGGFAGDGAAATAAQLSGPGTSAVDAAGNIYIADKYNHRIRKVSTSGIISTIAGTGTAGYSGDGGPATAAQLNEPLSLSVDASGAVYVADFSNNRIRRFIPGGAISTVAGSGAVGGFAGDGAAAIAALLLHPTDVKVDASGNIFICDYGNNRIRKVDAAGTISTIGGLPFGTGTDGDAATTVPLNAPNGIAVDLAGNVFIAELGGNHVRKISTAGIMSTVGGSGTYGYSGDGAAATAAEFRGPAFITLDIAGNIFFSDMNNAVVRRISASGIVNTVAGTGTSGYSGDGGPSTAAGLSYPTGVTFDAANNLYITEQGNGTVRKVTVGSVPITGTSELCAAANTTLSSIITDGVWTSSNTAVATVGSVSGIVSGLAAGTAIISYNMGIGAGAVEVTVNPLANAGAISGGNEVCTGSSISMTDVAGGGVWSSSNAAVASVSASGVVSGMAAGTATISYTVTNSCGPVSASRIVTVSACTTAASSIEAGSRIRLIVYPNPAVSGNLTFTLTSSVYEPVHFVITNIAGETVAELNSASNTATVMSTRVPAGMYIVSAIANCGRYISRIVIE